MRRLLPTKSATAGTVRADDASRSVRDDAGGKADIPDVEANVAAEPRPAPPDRPWVMVNMVASVDGASAGVDAKTASLSSEGDRRLFHALRAAADVVLAGASTVREENYGAPRPAADGRVPRLAVVSGSLALDPGARFFREPAEPPIVFTTEEALAAGRAHPELGDVAAIRAVGAQTVDWAAALRLLREEFGTEVLLVEGGPIVNGQLVDADLIDEFRLTVAPLFAGGAARRVVAGATTEDERPLILDAALEEEGFLFLKYLRIRH